jgi:hypothetical protein
MRRIFATLLLTILFLFSLGCTASDRDYVRNHIAAAPGKQHPILVSSKSPAAARLPR